MDEAARYSFQRFCRESEDEKLAFPELSDGFLPGEQTGYPGMMPVSFCTGRVPGGMYKVSMIFTADKDVEQLLVFTGRKQLRDILSLRRGERVERSYVLSAAEIIPRYQDKVYPVEHLFFTFCAEEEEAVQLVECQAERCLLPMPARIFLCGDSTVTDHAGEIPYCPGAGYAAWGQALTAFLPEAAVENQAHCGLTTEDFRKEGHFDLVLKFLQKGDICLFQFGHNDQKLAHLWPNGEFLNNLRSFVQKVQEREGFPVLVTPLARNIWDSRGQYLDLLEEHARAVMGLAEELNIPVLDLHGWSVEWVQSQGMEAARGYFHPGDYTHTNEYGAYLFAGYMAEKLAEIFPEKVGKVKEKKVFVPPKGLWERLKPEGRAAAGGSGKEAFDQMEKSTSGLAEMILKAREDSKDFSHYLEGR